MGRFESILSVLLAVLLVAPVAAGAKGKKQRPTIVMGQEITKDSTKMGRQLKSYVIIPKKEWQVGVQVAYADISSNNSEYMLLLDGINANGSIFRITPIVSFAVKDNQALGLRFQYTAANATVDKGTLDLLGNLSFDVNGVRLKSRTMGGQVYYRNYVGLDRRGRVGFFWDTILGYSRTKNQFQIGDPNDAYSLNKRLSLSFAPGVVYFPMNSVSAHVSVGVGNVSYNNVSVFDHGEKTGSRNFWKAQLKLSLLDVNLGITIHL